MVGILQKQLLLLQLGDELGSAHLDRIVPGLGKGGEREGMYCVRRLIRYSEKSGCGVWVLLVGYFTATHPFFIVSPSDLELSSQQVVP